MTQIAWMPEGAFPPELVAVMLPRGTVTRKQWLDALADRVTGMALKEAPSETAQACRMLGLPETQNPQEAGEFLVAGNLNLQTNLALQMESEFPMSAEKPRMDLLPAIKETPLMDWVELASSMVSASSLD